MKSISIEMLFLFPRVEYIRYVCSMQNIDILLKYFPSLSEEQKKQFEVLGELYAHWNAQINVVSRKDIDELYLRHVLHSLGIAKVTGFQPGTSVLDVGTGGGFPGIPLAIMFPHADFLLVDSIGKKIKVVNEVADSIGLLNLTAKQARAEKIDQKFDFIVSRAVTRMQPFWNWINKKFKKEQFNEMPNGVLYLKGGDLEEEMSEFNRSYTLFDLSEYFEEDFFETKKVVHVGAFQK